MRYRPWIPQGRLFVHLRRVKRWRQGAAGARIARPPPRAAGKLSPGAAAKASPNARRALGEVARSAGGVRRRGAHRTSAGLAMPARFAERSAGCAVNPSVMASAMTAPLTQGSLGCGGTKGLAQPLYPPREAADAARTRDARPYGENGEIAQKTVVCKIHPLFRGSGCGLRETFCSRNNSPILLARAEPGRGRQYGTGQPGGPQRPERCLLRGCTPRSPTGDRGPLPPAHFGNFSAVKSPPPEAKPACTAGAAAASAPARDSIVGARIARPPGWQCLRGSPNEVPDVLSTPQSWLPP